MESLFEVNVIDKHIESIIKYMLTRLPNNNPKKDSKCYLRVVNYINELYNGTFLKNKRFDTLKDSLFDMTDVFEKITDCMYDWGKVRTIITEALEHLEESKKPEKMPWNKTYINKMSFARFFNNGYNEKGEIVTDYVNQGTYNYADPNTDKLGHVVKDVIPYIFLGNSPNDPTYTYERVFGTYSGDVNTTKAERTAADREHIMNTYYEHH